MSMPTPERTWVPLSPRERRVVGVLVEKQKTTPDNYPMSLSALVTGCNQKSNRDPLTSYDADDVEEILHELRQKGAAVLTEGSGRVTKWKHSLYDWLDLKHRPAEMAVIAELLLRGPQTEGDLRACASRMDPIPDLARLEEILRFLEERALIVYLSPPGQRRGVVVTHGLYPPDELERVRQKYQQNSTKEFETSETRVSQRSETPTRSAGWSAEAETLRAEVQSLREQVEALSAELHDLKSSLGVE